MKIKIPNNHLILNYVQRSHEKYYTIFSSLTLIFGFLSFKKSFSTLSIGLFLVDIRANSYYIKSYPQKELKYHFYIWKKSEDISIQLPTLIHQSISSTFFPKYAKKD